MAECRGIVVAPSVGRRRRTRMAPASRGTLVPTSVVGSETGTLEPDPDWCPSCLQRGEKNKLRHLQIHNELAVRICDSEKCTSLPTIAPGSNLIVQRKAADITNLRKRKRRTTSIPSRADTDRNHLLNSSQEVANAAERLCNLSQTTLPSSRNTASALPNSHLVQWQNESALCWLDVSMLLLVQSRSLRHCHRTLGETTLLRRLCEDFDYAQRMTQNSNQEPCLGPDNKQRTQVSRTSDESPSKQAVKSKPGTDAAEIDLLCSYLRDELGDLSECTSVQGGVFTVSDLPEIPLDVVDEVMKSQCDSDLSCKLTQNTDLSSSSSCNSTFVNSSTSVLHSNTSESVLDDYNITLITNYLRKARRGIFETLKPKLQCKEGKNDSPVAAIPALLRLDGATEEHFASRYRREFYCHSCGFANVTVYRNVVASLTAVNGDFSMQHPIMHHPCPQCRAPGQTSRLVYHSMPTCPVLHFASGLSGSQRRPWSNFDFRHHKQLYRLHCIIQYKCKPDHFVIWIRDPAREMWLKCDDLASPLCHWQSQEPSIPPSEVHILAWERESGECGACLAMHRQIAEIEDSLEDVVMEEVACSHDQVAPISEKNCPVDSTRSLSARDAANATPATSSEQSVALPSNGRSQSLPSNNSGILSIGTPPLSPELESPKSTTEPSLEHDQSRLVVSNEAQHIQNSNSTDSTLPNSSDNVCGVGETESKSTKRTRSSSVPNKHPTIAGVLNSIPMQLIESNQTRKSLSESKVAKSAAISKQQAEKQNQSTLSMLRAMSNNSKRKIKPKASQGNAQSKKRANLDSEQHGASGRKLRLKLPRTQFPSFSAFKEKSERKFTSYLANKDTPPETAAAKGVVTRSGTTSQTPNGKLANGDTSTNQFQSSVLLTPSSSVSSPSACSDTSSQFENQCTANETTNLTSTIDELYKALDITDGNSPDKLPLSESCLDDSFLTDLLR